MAADPLLGDLAPADLHSLRLAAQVLRHKAEIERRDLLADYFARLADYSLVELAARGEGVMILTAPPKLGLAPAADREDRRLLAEFLGLLIANEHLSGSLRTALRGLRARDCR